MSTTPPLSDASLGALISKATQDVSALVQGNIDLAKAELRASAQSGAKGAGLVAGAVGLLAMAGLLISLAAVYGLVAAGLPEWAAFLIVAAVYLIVAVILGLVAKREFDGVKGPERAIAAGQETVTAITTSMDSGRAAAAGEPATPYGR